LPLRGTQAEALFRAVQSRPSRHSSLTPGASLGAPDSGFQELLHRGRHLIVFRKAPTQLIGNIDRDVARPALGGIEGNDPHRMAKLVFQETADQRLAVGVFLVYLAPSAPEPAKIV